MDSAAADLPVDPLDVLRQRRSAKWQTYPADVLPLTVAEMDFSLAAPVADALREAVERSDAGYAVAVPGLGRAIAGFAGRRWNSGYARLNFATSAALLDQATSQMAESIG
jgi:cystathionine beta-lyase